MSALLVAAMLALLQGPQAPAPSSGAPSLELDPPQVMVNPGQPFRVRAKTNASKAFFDIDGIIGLPEDWPLTDRKLCFYGLAPMTSGTHTITCTVFGGEERVIRKCLVIVGHPEPPGPGPSPPPPPPPPNDALTADLLACYAKVTDADKATHAATLSNLYRTAAAASKTDQSVSTVGQLFAKLRGASKLLIPDNALHDCRERLQREHATIGGVDTPLTPEVRAKAHGVFEHCAAALGSLK